MTAKGIHKAVHNSLGIVSAKLPYGGGKTLAAPVAKKVNYTILKRVIGNAVKLISEEVAATVAIGNFAGSVLPNLHYNQSLRVFFLDGLPEIVQESVSQLVGHI